MGSVVERPMTSACSRVMRRSQRRLGSSLLLCFGQLLFGLKKLAVFLMAADPAPHEGGSNSDSRNAAANDGHEALAHIFSLRAAAHSSTCFMASS